ncbi:hemerythrin domain-containing protein [Sphingosinicella sp. LY1275]|uniref:hemerythrin domain-containing protein n=1 Tax=Sphingosinicella sp. LY1275 TaxID=3095379 RepID=UPI002ADED870|nr:hemerythrin domain-containing protein [Sphingosinicella sp. LY1275]MEA1013522.1 hemerythrin domain-containing protein [Sphingosinicella sp. LY1275]
MATKTRAKGGSKSRSGESLFNWDNANTGVLVGAAVAGAAVGLAANMGRKMFVQMTSGASGDWVEALKTEHKLALAIFDKIQATDDSQTMMRSHLLAKLKYALTKHALEEENVIYPALRAADEIAGADRLNADHGYVKTYLYELETMAKDDPAWLARVSDFRAMIEEHMREEEEELFPMLRGRLSEEDNAKLSTMMNKEGFKFA